MHQQIRNFLGSGRQETKPELRAALDSLLALIDASPAAIFAHNLDGTICLWNRSAERIFGWRAEEVVGGPNPIVPEECRGEYSANWERVMRGEVLLGQERVRRRKDGSSVPISLSIAAMRDAQGRIIAVMSVIEDISERKKAEQALLDSEARYRLLFEANPHPMWVYDLETLAFLAVNEAAVQHYGWSREEFLGMTIRDIRPAEDLPRLLENIREIGGGIDRAGIWRHRRQDGSQIEVEITSHAILFQGRQGELVLANDITERLRAEREINQLAYFDHLTGLPNRALLLDRLGQLILQADRQGGRLAILFLDLDNFKRINDSLGHTTGDELLRAVAHRLQECLRKSDTVARFGGDEFVVLLTSISEERDLAAVTRQILEVLASPHRLSAGEVHVTASIGLAVFPVDGRNADTLLRSGDMAMYAAKERGRNTFQFFSEAMNRKAVRRMDLENSLRRAVQEEQFFLVYQPQFDLAAGRMTGVEALLRWPHPDRGLIPPGEFIPVAEETGLILDIGRWVLETACARARHWQEAGFPAMRMAVNISGCQFRQGDFAALVARVLQRTGLDPRWLELELTENMLMEPSPENVRTLRALAAMGILLSIDDFGVGYSSLGFLKKYPIDRIKIAQDFVGRLHRDPGDAGIVEAIIAMARSLNLGVIAEGVETREQIDFLAARGCREMQGYQFSRPLKEEELVRFFREGGVFAVGELNACDERER